MQEAKLLIPLLPPPGAEELHPSSEPLSGRARTGRGGREATRDRSPNAPLQFAYAYRCPYLAHARCQQDRGLPAASTNHSAGPSATRTLAEVALGSWHGLPGP